jgi:hypothetical protein
VVKATGRRLLSALSAAVLLGSTAVAEESGPPRDVDTWHEQLAAAAGGDLTEAVDRHWTLGIYPNAGAAAGPPEWLSYQLNVYLSLSDHRSFSLFAGYGYERGPGSESHMATLGWGGVRRLQAARPQRGFYGKFLRYRRIEDFDHGIHHGLSVGSETGAGAFGLAFEFGAARSSRNHWDFVVQVVLKVAFPMIVDLSRAPGTEPGG